MRSILVLAVVVLSGCSSVEWLGKTERSGYKDYDPCISCGEKWVQIPNEPFAAQKAAARGERW
jgi:hypothetical protein